jgi:hypothetical protein
MTEDSRPQDRERVPGYAVVEEATMRESGARLLSLHHLQGATGWTGGASGVAGIASRARSECRPGPYSRSKRPC